MNRKKIDNRIRLMIENNVVQGYRTTFAIVGPKARDQVAIVHHMFVKSAIKPKPHVLWCYKKELGFSSNRRKRMKMVKKKERTGNASLNEDDPFEMFISGTNIRWCYYHETDRIMGNTFDMLVLQDFEAITPNLLARTVETVEGGGIVIIILNTLDSLQQLYKMAMDVHNRYRTEAHKDVVARFNERFILSLASCPNFLGIDDKLNVLPLSSHIKSIEPVLRPSPTDPLPPSQLELVNLKKSLTEKQPLGSLVSCCKTLDQANAVITFINSLSDKKLRSTVAMTAARGRGKSAALGLAIAGAIAYNYSNIFVTSPSPENLKTLFEFIVKGLDAIHLKHHLDYEVVQSSKPDFNKAIIRIEVMREFKQIIQYIPPTETRKDSLLKKTAELLVIDEAAAVPLPIVRSLLGPYLVFMSSTINGYEGTGRSLSLKLLKQLRDENTIEGSKEDPEARILKEIVLEESIRYKTGDPVEAWLNNLLCLNANNENLKSRANPPAPDECELFYINRDTLFSFHPASEAFLQKLMALYVSSHYKNSPNDLQMMSDAPAHHLFCLIRPKSSKSSKRNKLPEIYCFLQVSLEGEISKEYIMSSLSKGKRASGDLIPWTLSQQFQDSKFPSLSGARIVRIATNPNYHGKGYGSRALKLLEEYYQGKFLSKVSPPEPNQDVMMGSDGEEGEEGEEGVDNLLTPRKNLPPLLNDLHYRNPERLDYMGVCYGMTGELLRFWRINGFIPVYIRQTANELTGEYSCIMVKVLSLQREVSSITVKNDWLIDFWKDFRNRFASLLSQGFRNVPISLALNIIRWEEREDSKFSQNSLTQEELEILFNKVDCRRISMLTTKKKKLDLAKFLDLIPLLSYLFFTRRLALNCLKTLSLEEESVLLGVGLQGKETSVTAKELNCSCKKLTSLLASALTKIASEISPLM